MANAISPPCLMWAFNQDILSNHKPKPLIQDVAISPPLENYHSKPFRECISDIKILSHLPHLNREHYHTPLVYTSIGTYLCLQFSEYSCLSQRNKPESWSSCEARHQRLMMVDLSREVAWSVVNEPHRVPHYSVLPYIGNTSSDWHVICGVDPRVKSPSCLLPDAMLHLLHQTLMDSDLGEHLQATKSDIIPIR